MSSYRRESFRTVSRLDVLEDEFPRTTCSVKGCNGREPHPWPGAFGTRYLCSYHMAQYRAHAKIVQAIRNIRPPKKVRMRGSTRTGAP